MTFLSSKKLLYILSVLIVLTHVALYFFPQIFILYTKTIFKNIHFLKGAVFSNIHFQLGEIIYILAAIYLVLLLYLFFSSLISFIKNKEKNRSIFSRNTRLLVNTLALFYLLLFYNWTILYGQQPNNSETTGIEYSSTDTFTLEKNNQLLSLLYSKVKDMDSNISFDINTYNLILRKEYQKHFSSDLPFLKTQNSIFRSFLSVLGITGYYHPFTGESYINPELNHSIQPFIMAHEMAHQLGVASESEANYTAYWLCENSESPELHYSAYMNVMMQCLYYIRRNDTMDFHRTIDTFSENVKKTVINIYEYRLKSRSSFSDISLGIYNWFLKSNNNGIGLKAYGRLRKDVYNYEINDIKRQPHFTVFQQSL